MFRKSMITVFVMVVLGVGFVGCANKSYSNNSKINWDKFIRQLKFKENFNKAKEFEDKIKVASNYIKSNPYDNLGYFKRGFVFLFLNKYNLAIQDFTKTLQLSD